MKTKNYSSLVIQIALCFLSCMVSIAHAKPPSRYSSQKYKYRIEQSHDKQLCGHMTHVFNRKFQTPWDIGWLNPDEPNPTFFGTPYDQVFERLPGVEYDKRLTFEMLLAHAPSSPEFDVIHWKEGRLELVPNQFIPFLFTQIDIDNDGNLDWLVKDQFLMQIPTYNGTVHGIPSQEDHLVIFPSSGFDPQLPLTGQQLVDGQKPLQFPRKLDSEVGLQIRPFIYQGQVYISAYQQVWRKKKGESEAVLDRQVYPNLEYMNILRVKPGGKRLHSDVIETANTVIVCRIRMLMINDTTSTKAN